MDALLGLLLVLVIFAVLVFLVERSVRVIVLVAACIGAVMIIVLIGGVG